jgi:uncharacterized protein (TIGR02996 family)
MDTRDRLLMAVFDHLDDPAYQLVFADWLEENGRADQASAIRLALDASRIFGQLPGLQESHRDEWQEHAGVTLTHEDFLLLFRWRLAEAMACAGEPRCRRLISTPEEVSEGEAPDEVLVQRAAGRRAASLRDLNRYPSVPADGLGAGRLMMVMIWGEVSDETPAVSDRFFNAAGLPPSATWLVFLDESGDHLRSQPEEPWPYLVTWVPKSRLEQAQAAHEDNTEIHWATDIPCNFTRMLAKAGLLG